jgi:hypothetical protein
MGRGGLSYYVALSPIIDTAIGQIGEREGLRELQLKTAPNAAAC